ncbi:DNA internalization-related competence protein ComEC/Rec2 [Radiobacillus sp. PE A8.2]|uniref:DNA internalization-related competence protein ComEC/Rec2 n=1 Tax=Radiobacillus sp. PE A8.2 TaxID=3380349 RepID=UPI003890933C
MKGYWHTVAFSACIAIWASLFYQVFLGFIIVLAWLVWLYQKQRLNKWQLLVCFICFIVFLVLYQDHPPKSDTKISNQTSFQGVIQSAVSNTDSKIEFVMEVENQSKVMVIYFKQVTDNYDYTNLPMKRGGTCAVDGTIELPPESRNPGQFDYRNFLLQKEIPYQVIVDEISDMECTGSALLHNIDELRYGLMRKTDQALSDFTVSWLYALLLGDDSHLSEETIELFQRWSLSHLLAISGLHVGLLVAIIYFLLVKCNVLTKEKARLILIFALPVYAVLAGGAPSVWRAALMTTLGMLLLQKNIRISITDVLSIIFLVLIILDPYQIYQLGFQFSFLITFSLLLSRQIFQLSLSKIYIGFAISFISQLIITPLQLYHFYFINPLSIVVNVLVVPYFSLIVIPVMVICCVLSLIVPDLAGIIDMLFTSVHIAFIDGLTMFDLAAFHPWVLGKFPLKLMIPYYASVILFLAHLMDKRLWHAFRYACISILLLIFLAMKPLFDPSGRVTMLDIGQGDSIIIELPYRKGVLFIDAAGSMEADFETSSTKLFDQIIKPYLYYRGINHVDAVVLSHADHDHIGSAASIIRDFDVAQMFVTPYFQTTVELQTAIAETNILIHEIQANDTFTIGDQQFSALSPSDDKGETNANSLVLYSLFGGKRWLFTGDIGVDEEKSIVATYPRLQIDVLKVAHHGSNSSTSEQFLKKMDPKIALISAGQTNRYGHPHQEIVDLLTKNEVVMLRTDEQGAIVFQFNQKYGTFFSYLP